jgi:hypothetical protein
LTGFKWSHLDRLYAIIHDYISQTREPSDTNFPSISQDPDQESTEPEWKKSETRFICEPKPEVAQAEKEVFKTEPKPKWWQFRKKRVAKTEPKPKAKLIESSNDTKEPSAEPDKPDTNDKPDYKLY